MDKLKKAAEYILDSLISSGGDMAQVSVSEGRVEEFNVDAGEFSLIRSVFNSGASMKVIKDMKKGTAAVNQLDKEAVDNAVAECITAAETGVKDEALSIAEKEENEDFVSGALSPDKEKFFDSLLKFIDDVKEQFPEIMLEQVIASYSYGKHVVANTNGVLFTEEDGSYSVSIMYSAHNDTAVTSFNCVVVDYLDPSQDILEAADVRLMLERAVEELKAEPFTGKFTGTAVFSPACLSEFVSTITDSFTGDMSLIEGTSPWKDSLGKKVAHDDFNVSVIPLSDDIVCGERITSDGYKAENFDVIKDGVLESFCLSEYAARKTGLPRAKSSSGCIRVKSGKKSLDEIIKNIENGILVCRFSGGEPAGNGDFSGVAKNSFLIKDGKIAQPLSETMISGNLALMVKCVEGISEESVNYGTCIMPYAAFGGITVSGAN
ncbi:MAG: TldD/PmbA family protein [Ruminococcaceae bacterium]|nr:TldD/PmbA family protein [Oscillospiraceae bacterium]MBR3595624.1 TldD/PmbA family protein [Clostridia bacterium]